MRSQARRAGPRPLGERRYTLPTRLVFLGTSAALATAVLTASGELSLVVWAFAVSIALLWRPGEVPAFPLALGLQWVFVLTGLAYWHATARLPLPGRPEAFEAAGALSALGLLVVALGARLGRSLASGGGSTRSEIWVEVAHLNLQRLFWWVTALYTVDWIVVISPMQIVFEIAQYLQAILTFKIVFLLLLLVAVAYRGQGYRYAAVALVVAFVPALGSASSAFTGVFVLSALAVGAAWSAGSPLFQGARRWHVAGVIAPVSVVTVILALIWQGGVKEQWRGELSAGAPSDPLARVVRVGEIAGRLVPGLDWTQARQSLVRRLSSDKVYFSYVLDRVPAEIPHAGGAVTGQTLSHVTRPRIFFPEKPNLRSDSWLVERFAGIPVAGPESGTSIGLGYIAESYIDFGIPGMFAPLLALGLLAGGLYGTILRVGKMPSLAAAAAAILLTSQFTSYGGNFAKITGGLLVTFAVYAGILFLTSPWFRRFLLPGGRLPRCAQGRTCARPGDGSGEPKHTHDSDLRSAGA